MSERKSLWGWLYKYKAHHVLLWISYFLFWVMSYYRLYSSIRVLILITCVYFIFNGTAFYTTAYFLFPKFLYKQKYGAFLLRFLPMITVLSIILGFCLSYLFRNAGAEFAADLTIGNWIQFGFMSNLSMTALLAGPKLLVEKIRTDKRRLETELRYLKAQVNPHFLFNAINSVYFLIKKNPDHAAETLIKLSDLLRVQLYDFSSENIAIETEIAYLNNFIALEKIRKGEKVKVDFDQDGILSGFHIPPFLLIPFVENAFKYVSNFSNIENKICIRFGKENGQFKAQIENTIDNGIKADDIIKADVGGLGLTNVKRRLELLYPEKHKLSIREDNGKYSVTLSLTIQ